MTLEILVQAYEFMIFLINFILKIDQYLDVLIRDYGLMTYVILFLIVFCETGLVVTPILPGDSLLFAAGALSARGGLNVHYLVLIIMVAAIIGDTVNYSIGKYFGEKLFRTQSRFFKKEYLDKTHDFYARYGNKTIVFCRFVPIVRTFAPFIAGVGKMNYLKFMAYNVVGAIAWSLLFVYGGYFFGNIPIIRRSLTLMIFLIIGISLLPLAFEIFKGWKMRKEKREELRGGNGP